MDIVRQRLSSCKKQNLSIAGRVKTPVGIICIIESLFKIFLRGSVESRNVHWVRWDNVCGPKIWRIRHKRP